jgi:hypothetical protein
MLKYLSKIAMDILPSVVATIIGAYIVNHYIVTKPGADAPATAAVSSVDPKKADGKLDAKLARTPAVTANIPEPGVKAKGISERGLLEKTAAERPAETYADKPAETASIPVETGRPAPREKAVAKAAPMPAAVAPVVAAPTTTAPVETAVAPEEHRDANELARAAIERLRGANEGTRRAPEAARVPDPQRVASAPVVATPPVRPLPPPIMVSTPATEMPSPAAGPSSAPPPYPIAAGINDPSRPTPPADIPLPRPLDLRAEAADPSVPDRARTVAEDMLSAAKSMFHAVLPKGPTQQ